MIVFDPKMGELYDLVGRLAPTSVPVLVTGETGTGKELLARAIQVRARRSATKEMASDVSPASGDDPTPRPERLHDDQEREGTGIWTH